MSIRRPHLASAAVLTSLLAASLAAPTPAQAVIPVVDFASITQLVSQVRTLQQQLLTARNQLLQAQTELRSMTGSRGMERLLGTAVRNYLPADWTEIAQALAGSSTAYPALGADLRATVALNAVLPAQALGFLTPQEQDELAAARRTAALMQVLSRQALTATSDRFAALQQLIDAIGAAGDQKAILDLQARISAEQGMLQNEHTKLDVLRQAVDAELWAGRERTRERVLAGHGRFGARFEPAAP